MNSEAYSSQIHPSDTKLIGQHLTVEMVNELDHTALDVRFFFQWARPSLNLNPLKYVFHLLRTTQ